MSNARAACQPDRDDIKVIKRQAAEAGIPKKELSAVIRKRRLLKKAEHVHESLNETKQETFDQIQFALGMLADLPRGRAALEKSGNGGGATVDA